MEATMVKIQSKNGLHARPAQQFIQEALSFESDIFIRNKMNELVNAKSLTNLLLLELNYKDEVEIVAEGKDSVKAIEHLKEIVEKKLVE